MPARRTALSGDRRQALAAELRLFGAMEARAAMDKYVHIAMASEAGMSLRDIAEVYDVSAETARSWKAKGEAERERLRKQQGDTDS